MNKDKSITKIKRKPNWKFYTLILSIFVLVATMILTLFFYGIDSWLLSILFPVILSAGVSAGVSLWFTMRSEKDCLADELIKEINGVHTHLIRLSCDVNEIAQNPLFSIILKKQILHSRFFVIPDMYRIKENYKVLYDLYKTNRDKMINELQSWDDNLDYNEFIDHYKYHGPVFTFLIMEIIDTALKVQEQYYQDFRGEPKAPIPDQLIHKIEFSKSEGGDK